MATEKWLMAFNPITFESFIRHATKHREPYDHYDMGYVDAVDQIEDWLNANNIDAVEVKHGQWLYDSGSGKHFCSVCNEDALDLKRNKIDGYEYWEAFLTDFCPNCGASMRDGDGNDI